MAKVVSQLQTFSFNFRGVAVWHLPFRLQPFYADYPRFQGLRSILAVSRASVGPVCSILYDKQIKFKTLVVIKQEVRSEERGTRWAINDVTEHYNSHQRILEKSQFS